MCVLNVHTWCVANLTGRRAIKENKIVPSPMPFKPRAFFLHSKPWEYSIPTAEKVQHVVTEPLVFKNTWPHLKKPPKITKQTSFWKSLILKSSLLAEMLRTTLGHSYCTPFLHPQEDFYCHQSAKTDILLGIYNPLSMCSENNIHFSVW